MCVAVDCSACCSIMCVAVCSSAQWTKVLYISACLQFPLQRYTCTHGNFLLMQYTYTHANFFCNFPRNFPCCNTWQFALRRSQFLHINTHVTHGQMQPHVVYTCIHIRLLLVHYRVVSTHEHTCYTWADGRCNHTLYTHIRLLLVHYRVAATSRLLKIIGLFCKRAL